jgi:hypothetical protein
MPKPNSPKNLSVLADFSVYHGSEGGSDQTLIGTMFGGRWTFAPRPEHGAPYVETTQKVLPSVHGLLGSIHTKGGDTVPALAVGGAVDIMLGGHLSSRAGLGLRFMADYVVRHGDAHNLARVSADLVWQFAKRH